MRGATGWSRWAVGVVWIGMAGCGDTSGPTETEACDARLQTVTVEASGGNTLFRLGQGLPLAVRAVSGCGVPVAVEEATWTSSDTSVVHVRPFRIIEGENVSEDPRQGWVEARGFGEAEVRVEVEGVTGRLPISVTRPETRSQAMEVLGLFTVPRPLTDLWAYGNHVYAGTNPGRCGPGTVSCESLQGSLLVWTLGPDGLPTAVDSVTLPGAKTNDVKVSPGGDYLVASQEFSGSNGIVVLSLEDPARPSILTVYTLGLEAGVHNVWLERIGGTDYAFVAENGGGAEERLHVLDLSDPAAPRAVTAWSGGGSAIHDVYVRDGLAFVSHWDDGLVILDVGDGRVGGSPEDPREVGRVVMEGGNTHNAWYWPEGEVVFVGEETFGTGSALQGGPQLHEGESSHEVGQLHVIDVSDMTRPREVAHYLIEGTTPHNFWVDEENRILYAAWYDRGVRALDVSGTLSGDLSGREIGFVEPSGPRGLGSIWAPQLHRGRIYLSDQRHGIWTVTPVR